MCRLSLFMCRDYIIDYFVNIKECFNVIKNRLIDGCTMEIVLEDNGRFWSLSKSTMQNMC